MNRSASQPAVLRNPEEGASWHANKTAARLLGGESQNGGVMQLSIIPKSLEEAGVKAFVEDQAFLVDCYTHLMLYAGAAGAQGVSEEYRSTMRILQPLGRAYETGPECEEHARRRLVAAGLEMHFLELLGRPGRPKPSKLMQIGFWTAVDTFRRTAPSVDLHQPVKEAQELILRRIEQLLGHTNPTKRKGETGKPEENRDQ